MTGWWSEFNQWELIGWAGWLTALLHLRSYLPLSVNFEGTLREPKPWWENCKCLMVQRRSENIIFLGIYLTRTYLSVLLRETYPKMPFSKVECIWNQQESNLKNSVYFHKTLFLVLLCMIQHSKTFQRENVLRFNQHYFTHNPLLWKRWTSWQL